MLRETEVQPATTLSAQTTGQGSRGSHAGLDPLTVGTAYGILAAVAYTAANIALRQVAHTGGADWAIWVSCLKAVPAAVVAWILIAYRAARGLPALPPRRLVGPLVLAGLFMQFAGNVAFQWGLSLGGLALTVPLVFATVNWGGAVLGRIFLAEPITRRSLLAMAVLCVSILLLRAGTDEVAESVTGKSSVWVVMGAVACGCSAGLAYATTGVVIRRTVRGNISLSASLVLLSTTGVVALGLASLIRLGPERLLATPSEDLSPMCLAGLFNAIAFFSIGESLRHITVVRANLLNTSQIAMAAVAGVAFFGEAMTAPVVFGTALTGLRLLLVDKPKQPTSRLRPQSDRSSQQESAGGNQS